MNATLTHRRTARPDPLELIADRVSSRLKVSPAELASELHRLLDGPDSRTVRVYLMSHLVEQETRDVVDVSRAIEAMEEKTLTTEAAAELLGCSRPHVAMLIDAGRLPGATRTEGGHRRVPEASVLALKKERDAAKKRDANYRAAGKAAGIYDIPEEEWVEAAKRGR
ncbi:excisionase family DNA-binding protein [Ramlibacter sp.]|uniref:excisionase family DNA-binding protein n=1 Tax=Ramlibacter sp. TaxID=1917967 RepID=UPI003D14A1B5